MRKPRAAWGRPVFVAGTLLALLALGGWFDLARRPLTWLAGQPQAASHSPAAPGSPPR